MLNELVLRTPPPTIFPVTVKLAPPSMLPLTVKLLTTIVLDTYKLPNALLTLPRSRLPENAGIKFAFTTLPA